MIPSCFFSSAILPTVLPSAFLAWCHVRSKKSKTLGKYTQSEGKMSETTASLFLKSTNLFLTLLLYMMKLYTCNLHIALMDLYQSWIAWEMPVILMRECRLCSLSLVIYTTWTGRLSLSFRSRDPIAHSRQDQGKKHLCTPPLREAYFLLGRQCVRWLHQMGCWTLSAPLSPQCASVWERKPRRRWGRKRRTESSLK